MLAVHFGAGNIGRGFIGSLLYQSDYDVTFVDVNDTVIQALNENRQYHVQFAAENKESFLVKNVSGINSAHYPEKVVEAIVHADIVTTAVGPNVLPIIAELVAKGLQKRNAKKQGTLNVIACENMIGASTLLRERVLEYLPEKEQESIMELIGFPNAAVDRIVPNQEGNHMLDVSVEPYYEWVVDVSEIKGRTPSIKGITFVDALQPYIERKLFTVNTGHAVPAYIGYHLGYDTIYDAMNDSSVLEMIKGVLGETGEALIQSYHFDQGTHQGYMDKIINRFRNPYISDAVTRVGRGPIRKLGAEDRLIKPALMYTKVTGKQPYYLAKLIAAVLLYDHPGDSEAVKLQQMIKEHGYSQTLQNVCGLDEHDPLLTTVMESLSEWKNRQKS